MPSKGWKSNSITFIIIMIHLIFPGCASVEKKSDIHKEIVFVPPFHLKLEEYAIERRGWWLGSEDYFQVDNLGFSLSEQLRMELQNRNISIVNYQEARHFQNTFLEEQEITEERLTYFDWSRLIGSPYVLMGKINPGGTAHNRALHAWYVDLTVEVFLQDVRNGEILYHKTYKTKKYFQSLTGALEELSRQISDDIFSKS